MRKFNRIKKKIDSKFLENFKFPHIAVIKQNFWNQELIEKRTEKLK